MDKLNRVSSLIFVLLCGCAHRSDPWTVSEIRTGSATYDCKKLSARSDEPWKGLAFDVLHSDEGNRFYLSTEQGTFPDTLTLGDREIAFTPLRGDEKVLLSDEAAQAIIALLESGQTAHLAAGPYSITLSPKKFEKRWRYFNQRSALTLPKVKLDLEN